MFTFSLLLGLALTATPAHASKLKIVTTTTDLRSIASEIAGPEAEVISLCPGRQDPHFVDPKPTFLSKLRDADLFILVGLELEIGWVPPLLDSARNSKILRGAAGYLDISQEIPVLELPKAGTTRAEGDIHPYGNPHYMFDPLNGKIAAREICAKLKKLNPDSAANYDSRLAAFLQRLDEALFGKELVESIGGEKLERLAMQGEFNSFLKEKQLESKLAGWLGKLKSLKGTKVVTYHRTLSYMTERFGLEVLGYVEPKPGIPPSAGHVADLTENMKKQGVKMILTHEFYDEKIPDLLAEKTGAKLIVLPASVDGVPEAKDYVSFIDSIVSRLMQSKP